ncbi:bifunctional diguanylate cyclase/phosphodiesterase [uncultured Sphingomonas sp.]|uniref:putative bifunctional diguanylate cyclase/phosphodiesterase n=1 Tax=uncultured Sphingomonas sp. TaxID=158754 RepID=UPI0025E952CF|nr:bifunctional diguanylate cyclase/phosphodiesterase [uncultured Sphingomonas sp.]
MQFASLKPDTIHSAPLDTAPLIAVEIADVDPLLAHARQDYLDAIHIPAALVLLDAGTAKLAASNLPFRRLVKSGDCPEKLAGLIDPVRAFLHGEEGRLAQEWREPGIGGRTFQLCLSRMQPQGGHDRRALVTLVDRTAEVETERSLRAEMLHDSLTGLPNRVAFGEAVDEAIDHAPDGRFSILSVDLNRFSRINECVGALAGDELIITAARRLVSALRAGDLLARMGGDEFGVLLRDVDGDEAVVIAQRLLAALAPPVRLSDLEIRVDCSIGCAVRDETVKASGDLLRNAHVALKRAKASARIELYRSGEASQARRRFMLETQLRRAIDRDELTLAFQPLIDLQSGRVSGFEALARWQHPDLGMIAPTEFISVAEECGLIVPLGRWALDATMRTLAQWDREQGTLLPVKLCVNVSPVQLARDTLDTAVRDTLAHHRITGDRLTLELTESSIVADPDRANRVLRALHDHGCRVAMDDFGTGYSSLAYLQRLPIDILKIDRSFVTDMHENGDSVAIIRAILSLARTLGMSTTAEGIETEAAERTLTELGCTTGQGYLFAKPLAESCALNYFRQRSA